MKALLKEAEGPYNVDDPKKAPKPPNIKTNKESSSGGAGDIKVPKPDKVKFKPVKSSTSSSSSSSDSPSTKDILKNIRRESEKQEERAVKDPDVKPQ